MNEQTAPEWRDCADPDELAAAVAAGVEVLAMGRAGDFPTANQTADQFAGSLRAGITYQLPPPAPPWPGAVLSGLTDEDGVPTWLAQAGQVRGEQVRGWRDMAWYRPHGHSSDTWVEVRAPRAVPEPETERVKLWDAFGRKLPDGRVVCGWQWSTATRDGSVTTEDDTFTPVHDAPTVEVLKDGDR